MTTATMTIETEKLFVELGEDAGNWGGQPMLDYNVSIGRHRRGNLTDLKKLGLLRTEPTEMGPCVVFTDKGKELLKNQYGINIRD